MIGGLPVRKGHVDRSGNEKIIGKKKEPREARRKALALGLLVAAFVVAATLLTAAPTHVATFTVNSTGDQNDLDFPGGTFDGHGVAVGHILMDYGSGSELFGDVVAVA